MTSNMELPSLPTRDELQVTLLPRPHSARIESSAKQRPKPNRSQNHSKMANVTDENMAPNLEAHQLTLSSTSECPLRRTAEIPLTKPTRSMSMGGEGTRPAAHFEDDFVLKLPTLALQAPASIAGHQLAEVLGKVGPGELYDQILILDARFAYEYQGGHIVGADNVYLPHQQDALKEKLLGVRNGDRLMIVIHCEFSSHRGPRLFRLLRRWDRELNAYPNLFFPEMYVLNGGYKDFFSKYPQWCTSGYVPMHHRDYMDQCAEAVRLTSEARAKSMARSTSALSRMQSSPLFGIPSQLTNSASQLSVSASAAIVAVNGHSQMSYSSLRMETDDFVISGHSSPASHALSTSPHKRLSFSSPGKQESTAPNSPFSSLLSTSPSPRFAMAMRAPAGSLGASSQDSTSTERTMDTSMCDSTDEEEDGDNKSGQLEAGWVSLGEPSERYGAWSVGGTRNVKALRSFAAPSSPSSFSSGPVQRSTGGGARLSRIPMLSRTHSGPQPFTRPVTHTFPVAPLETCPAIGSPTRLSLSSSELADSISANGAHSACFSAHSVSTLSTSSSADHLSSRSSSNASSVGVASVSFIQTQTTLSSSSPGFLLPTRAHVSDANSRTMPAPAQKTLPLPRFCMPGRTDSAPPRSTTFHALPASSKLLSRGFTRSTSDLPNWHEDEEDDLAFVVGAHTSRH